MTMRGLVGPPPVVAAGVNTADPYYVPTAAKTAPIKRGDLIVISLAAKVDKPEGIYAAQTWCAVADKTVPEAIAKAFDTASLARDQALVLITDRSRKQRPVTGAEVDDATRALLQEGRRRATGHAPHRALDRQRPPGRRRRPRRLRGQGHAHPDARHRLHGRAGPLLPGPVRRAHRGLGVPVAERARGHDARAGRRRGAVDSRTCPWHAVRDVTRADPRRRQGDAMRRRREARARRRRPARSSSARSRCSRRACAEIMVVDGRRHRRVIARVRDALPDVGPLAGIAAGLAACDDAVVARRRRRHALSSTARGDRSRCSLPATDARRCGRHARSAGSRSRWCCVLRRAGAPGRSTPTAREPAVQGRRACSPRNAFMCGALAIDAHSDAFAT